MRLLLIEDDKMLARGTAAGLAQSGYAVKVAENGAEALRLATDAAAAFDIGILDLGLPDIDGIDLLRDLRARGIGFPILILSARDGLNDRIRGLDLGADDYLTKPFALGELEARLRALLRRTADTPRWQQLGRLRFDAAAKVAVCDERDIELTARELSILAVLMKQPKKIVSKQVLFDEVFSYETDAAPNALEVHVSRLRQKLKGTGATIRSLRGLGYRIEGTEEQPDADGGHTQT